MNTIQQARALFTQALADPDLMNVYRANIKMAIFDHSYDLHDGVRDMFMGVDSSHTQNICGDIADIILNLLTEDTETPEVVSTNLTDYSHAYDRAMSTLK